MIDSEGIRSIKTTGDAAMASSTGYKIALLSHK